MPSVVYHLTFSREMMNAPILGTLAKRFRISVTIRRAMLSEEGGTVEVAFSGPLEEIQRTLADLQTTGVTTQGPLEVEATEARGPIVNVGRGT